MSHPISSDVALFAGGELPLWKRWRVGCHLRQCPECRREVEAFSKEREWFREAAGEIPAEFKNDPVKNVMLIIVVNGFEPDEEVHIDDVAMFKIE